MLSVRQLLEQASKYPLYNTWNVGTVGQFADAAWQALPTTTRDDIRRLSKELDAFPGESGAGRLFFSSGTTGNPKMIRYGTEDLERVAKLCARFAVLEGVTIRSRVMVLLPMALWSVGKITWMGHLRARADVYPVDLHGGIEAWQRMADRIRPTVISSTPSVLAAWAPHYNGPKLELIETTGEPLLTRERHVIEAKFGGFVFDAYGLSECVVGVNCKVRDGFHYWTDAVGVEILDAKENRPVADGESGEIVLTSFMQTRMPIIRYRTGDKGRMLVGPCPCGHTSPRLGVEGRLSETYQMPRGVNLSPSDLHAALSEAGVEGKVVWKGSPGSPAAPYVEKTFRPTLEVSLFDGNSINSNRVKDRIMASLPDLAELVYEDEILLDLASMS